VAGLTPHVSPFPSLDEINRRTIKLKGRLLPNREDSDISSGKFNFGQVDYIDGIFGLQDKILDE